jgi:GTP-binding protein HflX
LHETAEKRRRAFLIGIRDDNDDPEEAQDLLRELEGLTSTLGVEIAGKELVHIRERSPKYGMGSGKAGELAALAKSLRLDCFIFDRDLNPTRQRNWEALSGISAIDRQELIIQIFARHAKTREAALQVEAAELRYSRPRLSHRYIDLSRQRGGRYGTKGAGETKLELDRRRVERRLARLEVELRETSLRRAIQRRRREKAAIPRGALVGYTNAGKSSLLNALTGADALVEDKLFATLDAATRRMNFPSGKTALLTDTVGFIRRLPHDLVNSFRSTLEEAALADFLIHVLDASDPRAQERYQTTMSVLADLGAGEQPMLLVLNKTDITPPENLDALRLAFPAAIPVSVKKKTGIEHLRKAIEEQFLQRFPFPQFCATL